jgi:uncharacterized protein (DUF433 family)
MAQVDRILALTTGTARRWLDGYQRAGRSYLPVVRIEPSGVDVVTWGEFVEVRLLAEYRDAGVPLSHMRPVVERLRSELGTQYPLASAKTWLAVDAKDLVLRIQEEVGLEPRLAIVVRTGQVVPDWSTHAAEFRRSVDWTGDGPDAEPRLLRPKADIAQVVVDPLRGFGEPAIEGRAVTTEVIAELVRAGDPPDMVAELYDLPRSAVDAAVRYELLRVPA